LWAATTIVLRIIMSAYALIPLRGAAALDYLGKVK
jgi:hypothetical protein